MNKTEFSNELRRALGKLPSYEVEQSIAFYTEAIDDRMEDGMAEEDAVAALGPINAIAAQIIAETPPIPKAIAKANTGSRTLNIVLLVLCSPFWVPLTLVFACTLLAVYLAIWCVIVALWAVVAVLLLCAPLGFAFLAYCIATGFRLTGVYMFGCCLICSGLGLFAWFGVLAASKALVGVTHTFARWVRGLFKKQRPENNGASASGPTAPADMPQPPVATTTPYPFTSEGVQNYDNRA